MEPASEVLSQPPGAAPRLSATDVWHWAAYTRQVVGADALRLLYSSWQVDAPTLGYLLRYRPPPARVLSIGCNIGMLDMLLAAHG